MENGKDKNTDISNFDYQKSDDNKGWNITFDSSSSKSSGKKGAGVGYSFDMTIDPSSKCKKFLKTKRKIFKILFRLFVIEFVLSLIARECYDKEILYQLVIVNQAIFFVGIVVYGVIEGLILLAGPIDSKLCGLVIIFSMSALFFILIYFGLLTCSWL